MKPLVFAFLPDRLTEPVLVLHVASPTEVHQRRGRLAEVRTGEDTRDDATALRRYELTLPGDPSLSDLATRRFVVGPGGAVAFAASGAGSLLAPSLTLHPERHDLASWVRAAAARPDAPWVRHLALTIRDALRAHREDPVADALLVVSDHALARAVPAGSIDASPFAPIFRDLNAVLVEIDLASAHGDPVLMLKPLPDARRAVVTRSQAAVAAALVGDRPVQSALLAERMAERWARVVAPEWRPALRQDGPTRFSFVCALQDRPAPERSRPTLVLARVRILLDPVGPDVRVEHLGFGDGPSAASQARDAVAAKADRDALDDAALEGRLPLLDLAGADLWRLPSSVETRRRDVLHGTPLLAAFAGAHLAQAVHDLVRFRLPHAKRPTGNRITSLGPRPLLAAAFPARWLAAADPDAESRLAPDASPPVGEPDHAGEAEPPGSAKGAGDRSPTLVAPAAVAGATTPRPALIPAATSPGESGSDTEGTGTEDRGAAAVTGEGPVLANGPDVAPAGAVEAAVAALAEAPAPAREDDAPLDEAEDDPPVTDPEPRPAARPKVPRTGKAAPRPHAGGDDHADGDAAEPAADPSWSAFATVWASISETDRSTVSRVRASVARSVMDARAKGKPAPVGFVADVADLDTRVEAVEKVYNRLVRLMRDDGPRRLPGVRQARAIFEGEIGWAKLLILCGLAHALVENRVHRNYSLAEEAFAALIEAARLQAAAVPDLRWPAPADAAQSPSMDPPMEAGGAR